MEFSGWLRTRLKESPDLNQARLAEALGVYASTIHFWVKGRSLPDLDKVPRLAEIFNVEQNTIYKLLGHDVGQPYEFKILGPIVEEIDRILEATADPEDRALIEERLKNDLRAAKDTLEALNQRREKSSAP